MLSKVFSVGTGSLRQLMASQSTAKPLASRLWELCRSTDATA